MRNNKPTDRKIYPPLAARHRRKYPLSAPQPRRDDAQWPLCRVACGYPDELVRHNCVRLRFAGTGVIYKWEFQVNGRLVEYEVKGNLTISDTLFHLDAALEGVGLAYTFEQLALPYIRAKRLKRVLASFSPTFPGFYLYYPSRRNQPTKLKALIEYASRRTP